MDVIEKLIAGHREVKEYSDISDKLAELINNDAFFWDNAVRVTKFFKKEVREHFAIEESVLFPLLEKILPPDVLDNLSEIENEHGPIIKKLDELDRISLQHLKYPSKTTRELFVKVCGEIIELLLPHARREDGDIFPAVRKIFSDANYRELENLYFKYMES